MLRGLSQWLQLRSRKTRIVSKRGRQTVALRVELLEDRLAPVVGTTAIPAPVMPGGFYDGVVLLNAVGSGTGSLIQPGQGHYILTVQHNNPNAAGGTTAAGTITFNLQRNGIPVNVAVPLPANVGGAGAPPAAQNAFVINNARGAGQINDIALWKLVDPVAPAANRLLVAPFSATQYGLYTQMPVAPGGTPTEFGQTMTFSGYGNTGTGRAGENAGSSSTKRLGLNLFDNLVATATTNTVMLLRMPTGGNFQVGWMAATAAQLLNQNSTEAEVLAALNSLPAGGVTAISGNVTVQRVAGMPGNWWIQFYNGWAGQAVPLANLTVTNSGSGITSLTEVANINGVAGVAGQGVSVVTTVPHNFVVGQPVNVAGAAIAGYNGGPFTVRTIVNATTFTYGRPNTGLLVAAAGGTVTSASGPAPPTLVSTGGVAGGWPAVWPLDNNNLVLDFDNGQAVNDALGLLYNLSQRGLAAVPEVQTITITGGPNANAGSTFRLAYQQALAVAAVPTTGGGGNTLTTAAIGRNASADAVQTALEALAPLAPSQPLNPSFQINAATEAGNLVTITTAAAHSFVPGQMVTIFGAAVGAYDGSYPVVNTPTATSFSYVHGTAGLGVAGVAGAATAAGNAIISATKAGTTVTITTGGVHNFLAGQTVTINGVTIAAYDGTFRIDNPTPTTFTYTLGGGALAASSAGTAVRAGAAIASATSAGNVSTITTAAVHNYVVGQMVTIAGVTVAGYNGPFRIVTVPNADRFTYTNPNANLADSGNGTVTSPGAPTIEVTGNDGGPWTVRFVNSTGTNNLGGVDVSQLMVTDNALTIGAHNLLGGTTPQVVISTPTEGGHEASYGSGDSGGPNFIGNLLAGVTQGGYSFNSPPDIDTNALNASFGETMLAAKVSSFAQAGGWIPTTIAANVSAANPYHLVLDMSFQVAGISQAASTVDVLGRTIPAGPLPLDPITITASRVGAGATATIVLSVINSTTPSLSGTYFTGLANTIASLTIRGAGNNNTIQINGDLGIPVTVDGGRGTSITGAGQVGMLVTITTAAPHGYVVGQPVVISGVAVAGYNGPQVITAAATPTTFQYNTGAGLGAAPAGGMALAGSTINSGLQAGNAVTITTAVAHGFVVGHWVTIAGAANAGYNGTFQITATPTPTTFRYDHTLNGLPAIGAGGTATLANRLIVNDAANAGNVNYTVTAAAVTRAPGQPVNYSNFQSLIVNGGTANDTVIVNWTQPFPGVTVNGGGGANNFTVHNPGNPAATIFTVTNADVQRTGGGVINYADFLSLTLNTGTGAGNTVNVLSSRAGTDTSVNAGVASTAINVTNNGSLVGIAGPVYVTGTGGNNLHVNALAHPQGGVQEVQGVPGFFNPWPFSRITIGGAAPVHYRDVRLRYTLPEVPPLPPGIAFLTTPNPVDPLGQMTLVTSNLGDTVVFDLTNPLLTSVTTIDDSKGLATAEIKQGAVQSTQVAFLAATNLSVTGGAFNVVSPLTVASAFVSSGDLTVAASYTLTATSLFSQTGGTSTVQGTFSVAGNAALNGGVSRVSGGAVNVTGAFAQAADNTLDIGLQYPSVKAVTAAGVSLGGRLSLFWLTGFTPSFGQVFTIVDNTGASPVDGNFQGLPNEPDGVTFDMNGWLTHITYRGGDGGNDVVLTIVSSMVGQWANGVDFVTSEFNASPGPFSAWQATGPRDTFVYGDQSTAWSTAVADNGLEHVILRFATAVYATGVTIWETNNNGFVSEVVLIEPNGTPHSIWTGTDPTPRGAPAQFTISFPQANYLVDRVKVVINTNVTGANVFEQIDAVMLHGSAGGGGSGLMAGASGPASLIRRTSVSSVRSASLAPIATLSVIGPIRVDSPVTFRFTNPQATGLRYSFDFNNDGDFTDVGEVSDSTSPSATHTFRTRGWQMVHGRVRTQDGLFRDFWIRVFVE